MQSSTAYSNCNAIWCRRPSTDPVGCVHLNRGTTRLLHEDIGIFSRERVLEFRGSTNSEFASFSRVFTHQARRKT